MRRLSSNEMQLIGSGRCGGSAGSIAVEATLMAAGAFIGFGLSLANPAGAVVGASAGLTLGGLVCRSS